VHQLVPVPGLEVTAQVQRGLGVLLDPKLSRALEPQVDHPSDSALDDATALGQAPAFEGAILHPLPVTVEVVHVREDGLGAAPSGELPDGVQHAVDAPREQGPLDASDPLVSTFFAPTAFLDDIVQGRDRVRPVNDFRDLAQVDVDGLIQRFQAVPDPSRSIRRHHQSLGLVHAQGFEVAGQQPHHAIGVIQRGVVQRQDVAIHSAPLIQDGDHELARLAPGGLVAMMPAGPPSSTFGLPLSQPAAIDAHQHGLSSEAALPCSSGRVQDMLQPAPALLDGPPAKTLHQLQRSLVFQADAPALERGQAITERGAVDDLPVDLAAQRRRGLPPDAQGGQHGPQAHSPLAAALAGGRHVRRLDSDGGAPEQCDLGGPAAVELVLARPPGTGHGSHHHHRVLQPLAQYRGGQIIRNASAEGMCFFLHGQKNMRCLHVEPLRKVLLHRSAKLRYGLENFHLDVRCRHVVDSSQVIAPSRRSLHADFCDPLSATDRSGNIFTLLEQPTIRDRIRSVVTGGFSPSFPRFPFGDVLKGQLCS